MHSESSIAITRRQNIDGMTSTLQSATSQSSKMEGQEVGAAQVVETDAVSADSEKQSIKQDTSDAVWVTGFKLWSVMIGVTLVCFLMLLDIAIISTAIPVITSEFRSLEDIGWYGAAYQLASATVQPLTGKIYSNFSTKWTFFVFFLVFELGSLLCGVAVSSRMLIVGRAVAGLGASGLQNGALTIISGCVPMPRRPMLFGICIGGGQLGLVAGPLVGGLFTEYVTWRWCFYINLPVGGVIAAVLCFIHIPEQATKSPARQVLLELHTKLDLIGFAIFAPSIIMLLLAVQYGGNQYAWGSSMVIGLFCGAGANFLLWLVWDYHKKDEAMIPISMLRNSNVWSSCMVLLCLASAMFTTSYYLPVYFQGVLGKTPAISGVYLLPSILPQLFAGILAGKLIGLCGYCIPFSLLSAAMNAIACGLLSTLGVTTSTGAWVGFQILLGAGRGIGMQTPYVAIQNTLTPAQIPIAIGLAVFSQSIGGAIFLSVSGTLFTNSLRSLLAQDAPHVDGQAIIGAGAYGFRDVVPKEALPDVLGAYTRSVDRVFYMCAALAVCCFAFSWGMGWVDIRKKQAPADDSRESQNL